MARRTILAEMGYEFTIMVFFTLSYILNFLLVTTKLTFQLPQTADIDEKCIRKDKPEDLVMALAEAKVDFFFPKY